MRKKLTTIMLLALIILIGKVDAATLTQKIGSGYIKSTVNAGETVNLTFAHQANYEFQSWTVEEGNVTIDTTSPNVTFTMPSGNVTIRANYKVVPNHVITYNANGGTGTMASQSVFPGNALILNNNTYTKSGFKLKGWSENSTATSPTYINGQMIKPNKNMTLYAVWEEGNAPVTQYTLTYNANGGSGAPASQTGTTLVISSTVPTRDGYTFLGWSISSSATSAEYQAGGSIALTGNTTLYAVWFLGNAQAFAIYSEDDDSLTFYKNLDYYSFINGEIGEGDDYNDKYVTDVFFGFETDEYEDETYVPWYPYTTGGVSTISFVDEIKPISTAYWFADSQCDTIDFTNLNTIGTLDMSHMFSSSSMTELNLTALNTANVSSMYGMFEYCSDLTTLNISSFNTLNVVDMSYMFAYCNSLTELDLSNFNTINVTDMGSMFVECHELTTLNLSSFNTVNVTDMSFMFGRCESLTELDLSSFYMAYLDDAQYMFDNCIELQIITLGANFEFIDEQSLLPTPSSAYIPGADGKWYNTAGTAFLPANVPSNVADTYYAVYGQEPIPTLMAGPTWWQSEVDRRAIRYIDIVDNYVPTGDAVSSWAVDVGGNGDIMCYVEPDMSLVIVGNGAEKIYANENSAFLFESFINVRAINGLDMLDTSNVTNMSYMFYGCRDLISLDLSNFNTSNVTEMVEMFGECLMLTALDFSSFDTRNVSDMSEMLWELPALYKIKVGENFSVKGDGSTFCGVPKSCVERHDGYWYNTEDRAFDIEDIPSGIADTYYAVGGAPTLIESYGWYQSDIATNTITQINIVDSPSDYTPETPYERWDAADDGSIRCFIEGTTLTIVGNGTGRIHLGENAARMFRGFANLVAINGLNLLDTSKTTRMSSMFEGCNDLRSLDLSNFDTSKVEGFDAMFEDCVCLRALDLSSFDTKNAITMEGMFVGCERLLYIEMRNFNTSNVQVMGHMFGNCRSLRFLDISSFDTNNVGSMNYMFKGLLGLEEIKLGSNFSFVGCELPASNSGYWYNRAGIGFLPADIPNNVANTYYASQSLVNAPLELCRIVYNPNGGTGGTTTQIATSGNIVTLRLNSSTNSGSKFLGWSTNSSASFYEFVDGQKIIASGNLTLYAVWSGATGGTGSTGGTEPTTQYTITYDANGGSGAPAKQTLDSPGEITISNSYPTPPSGKAFRGWATTSDATVAEYKIGASIDVSGPTTLYAVYVTPLASGAGFSNVDIGAYVTYEPSSTSYAVATTASGYTSTQTFNPSIATKWRVFGKVGSSVEIISDESVTNLWLSGAVGYINAVQTLQDVSAAYVNSTYATSARSVGYSEVDLTSSEIANYKKIDTSTYPINYGVVGFPYEDNQMIDDKFVLQGNSSLMQNDGLIWYASRSAMSDSGDKYFVVDAYSNKWDGFYYIYIICSDGTTEDHPGSNGVRPIVTLKSTLKVSGGDGSPSNPYTLTN